MIQAHVKAQHSSPLVHCAFTSVSRKGKHSNEQALFARMALLSSQHQWLLFTAQTPRPSAKKLKQHNVCCDRVIHMKASCQMTEVETVEKAIRSKNASAIVASTSIDPFSQKYLTTLAKRFQCEVFFINANSERIH
ncbi:SulA-like leucine-rich domain-containing protein [uncultured Vibrio sp.]|uniref:SulA-like leucine-rich domain-containing protein n=1 Tax=uncultured Vibrio sp. TaxID=114054 RepID=UPI002612BA73|nr:SulA-like leucine-rich domain-containing protein [uncultured Vibrio sp.]